jgi:hypothetical protein
MSAFGVNRTLTRSMSASDPSATWGAKPDQHYCNDRGVGLRLSWRLTFSCGCRAYIYWHGQHPADTP